MSHFRFCFYTFCDVSCQLDRSPRRYCDILVLILYKHCSSFSPINRIIDSSLSTLFARSFCVALVLLQRELNSSQSSQLRVIYADLRLVYLTHPSPASQLDARGRERERESIRITLLIIRERERRGGRGKEKRSRFMRKERCVKDMEREVEK